MIVDTLDQFEKYVSVNPLFADIVKFLKENDLNTLEEGKHFIKDKDLFVNIQVAVGKTKEAAPLKHTSGCSTSRFHSTTTKPTVTCR